MTVATSNDLFRSGHVLGIVECAIHTASVTVADLVPPCMCTIPSFWCSFCLPPFLVVCILWYVPYLPTLAFVAPLVDKTPFQLLIKGYITLPCNVHALCTGMHKFVHVACTRRRGHRHFTFTDFLHRSSKFWTKTTSPPCSCRPKRCHSPITLLFSLPFMPLPAASTSSRRLSRHPGYLKHDSFSTTDDTSRCKHHRHRLNPTMMMFTTMVQ